MSLVASKLQLVPRPLDPGVVSDTVTHAYSTRRIRSGYQGPCLRVRRASDNAEQDVGFIAGQLDATSLLTFCAGSAGYVTTWYSQVPGVGNAVQTVAEFQPRICANGVIDTLGTSSKAALVYPNPEKQLIPPSGYTATASSTTNPNAPERACDRASDTYWLSSSTYTSGAYTGAVSTTIDGTALLGEWFQIVLPRAVVVTSLGIVPRPGAPTQGPKQFTLAASADGGTTWTSLYRTTTGAYTNGVETRFAINATKAYDVYRIVTDATTSAAVAFATFALYGTTASPVPQEVSLVPRMTADAHGDYVASASATYNGFFAYYLFDSVGNPMPGATKYANGTYTGTTTTTVAGIGAVAGEWIQIKMPTAVSVRRYGLTPRPTFNFRAPGQFVLAGSTDGTTWTLIDQQTATSSQYADSTETSFTVSSTPKTYTYFRLIATTLAGTSATATNLDLDQWTLYGFEPPQTFLTVPSSSGPQAIVGGMAPTYEQNLVPASGYTATASTEYNASFTAPRIFDRSQSFGWTSANLTYSGPTPIESFYLGSVTTTVTGLGNVLGEWVQIQLPAAARVTRYGFSPRYNFTVRCPRQFIIVGSNNGTTWEVVDQVTYSGFTYTFGKPTSFVPKSTTKSFSYYRLIVQTLFHGNSTLVDIAEWELYGIYDAPPPAQSLVPAMTADSHGWYRSSASSSQSSVWAAFSGITTDLYLSANSVYNVSTGAYVGAATTATNLGAIPGEYLDIAMPYGVIPTRVDIMPQTDNRGRCPRKFTVAGLNTNDTTWTVLGQFSGITIDQYTNLTYTTFSLPTQTQAYKTLRLITEEVFNTGNCGFVELQYYGYEMPTFVTTATSSTASASLTNSTHSAFTYIPSSLLSGTSLAAPPGSSLSEVIGVSTTAPSTTLQTLTKRVYAPPSSGTHKLTRAQPSSTNAAYALDALSTAAKSSIGAAFSTRRLLATYRGPLLRIRRSSDNVEQEWYGNPDVLDTFLAGGAIGYVAIWYDQSGLGKHATAPTTAEQPRLTKDRGRYVVNFDGTSRESSRYLTFASTSTRSAWSQFYIVTQNQSASQIFGNTTTETGLRLFGLNVFEGTSPFLAVAGSVAYIKNISYIYENGAQNVPLQQWTGLLGVRGGGTSQAINSIARNYYSGVVGQTLYRDFTGYMSDLVLFTAQLTNNADATVLYAARAINDSLQNTQPRGVVKASLYGSSSLIASLTDSAKRVLVEGRLTRDSADLVTLASELARLGPNLAAPITSPTSLKLAGTTWAVPFDYVIKRGSATVSSGFSADAFFTSVKDTQPAFVVIDGNLTIDANATFTPPTRKLFTVIYVTGNLTVNGTISMTARGANHSGTGDSGGYVAPQDILILNGTRDGVSSPKVPATGGAGGVGNSVTTGNGNSGGGGTNGGSGGGGAGGRGSLTNVTGNGAAGTSFCGGSGGGGSIGPVNTPNPRPADFDGTANGGAGGFLYGDTVAYTGSQGGGNPLNGAGGTLIIYVGGVLIGNGRIQSQGSVGSPVPSTSPFGLYNNTQFNGASGGGSVTVMSTSGGDLVGLSATGGQPDYRGGLGGNGTARLLRTLAGPVISARVRDLSTLTNGAVVASWGSWTASSPTQPTYISATTEVAFDRTLTQYMTAGARTFNIGTNEGFTMVVQFKFTGTALTSEVLLEVGDGFVNRLGLLRFSNQSMLRVLGSDGGATLVSMSGGTVAQNTWYVASVRYIRINNIGYAQLFVNNTKVVEQDLGATTLANRTNTLTYLGRAVGGTGFDFNGSMRFAGMWDRALTDAELTGLYASLTA